MSKLIFIAAVLALALCYVNGEICPCPRIMAPICGSDGRTYSNKCEFSCARKTKSDLKILHNGRCKAEQGSEKEIEEPVKCFCTMEFRQVCGSNGRTYSNPCLLKCDQRQRSELRLAHQGPCESDDNSVEGNSDEDNSIA